MLVVGAPWRLQDRAKIRFPEAVFPKMESTKEENAALFKNADGIIIYLDDLSYQKGRSDGTKVELQFAINEQKLDSVFMNDEVITEISQLDPILQDVDNALYEEIYVDTTMRDNVIQFLMDKYETLENAMKELDVTPDDVEEALNDVVDHAEILEDIPDDDE